MILWLLAVLGSVALSMSMGAAARSCTKGCTDFDFLVGNWIVRDNAHHVVGTDTVWKRSENCTLIETWLGAGATGEGLAVMTYQSAKKTWRRSALLRIPVVLDYEGGMTGGSMVMTAKQYPASGPSVLHRITWNPQRNGSVKEVWQTSIDSGKSWQIRLDETLTRIGE